jgi:hypothetical protein
MRKFALVALVAGMSASVNSFAADGGKKKKADCRKETACSYKDKSCCKKPAKAALLKAKAGKVESKKAA